MISKESSELIRKAMTDSFYIGAEESLMALEQSIRKLGLSTIPTHDLMVLISVIKSTMKNFDFIERIKS